MDVARTHAIPVTFDEDFAQTVSSAWFLFGGSVAITRKKQLALSPLIQRALFQKRVLFLGVSIDNSRVGRRFLP
jgi:hypothetical protein